MPSKTRLQLAISMLAFGLGGASVHAQTRALTTGEIARVSGPSVVKLEVHDKLGTVVGQASGVVIAPGGVVATNFHVVADACNLYIKAPSGSLTSATGLLSFDINKDIAIAHFDSKDLPAARLGESRTLRVGDKVVAIGNPLGLEQTVSEGIVSALRNIENNRAVIQTTVPISPGSSGGGLFNSRGELVGLTAFTLQDSQNLNFAVPLTDVMESLKRSSDTEAPWGSWVSLTSACSGPSSTLDAMIISQQLLDHDISDPQVMQVMKNLSGGMDPMPTSTRVSRAGEQRLYGLPAGVVVSFTDGQCGAVSFVPQFKGILPLGLSWDKVRTEVLRLTGAPSQTEVANDGFIDHYWNSGKYRYDLVYTGEKLDVILVGVR
jgi:S1-C subfamily serine protease